MARPRMLSTERRPGEVLNRIQQLVYEHWGDPNDVECMQMRMRVSDLVRAPVLVPLAQKQLEACRRACRSRRHYLQLHTGDMSAGGGYAAALRSAVTTAELAPYMGDLPQYLRPAHPAMFALVREKLPRRYVAAMNEAAGKNRAYNTLQCRLRRVAKTLALQAREIDRCRTDDQSVGDIDEVQRTYALTNSRDADVAFHDME